MRPVPHMPEREHHRESGVRLRPTNAPPPHRLAPLRGAASTRELLLAALDTAAAASRARDTPTTVANALSAIDRVVPLRLAIVVEGNAGAPAFVWPTTMRTARATLEHVERARALAAYFAGKADTTAPADTLGAARPCAVTLPLVDDDTLVGVVHAFTRRPCSLDELAFLAVATAQLAIVMASHRRVASALGAVSSRDATLAMVVHDLKNPLAAILLHVGALRKQFEESGCAASRRGIDAIERCARSAGRLLSDILDTSGGALSVRPRACAVDAIVAAALDVAEGQARARDVELTLQIARELPPVHVDFERVVQVLWNLLGNAFKFTPRGGRVALIARRAGTRLVLSVSDTGIGLKPDECERVFDRFWQARPGGGGIGLGLAIVKRIVNAHGGAVWVDSQPNVGTTFSFSLPVATPSAEAGARLER